MDDSRVFDFTSMAPGCASAAMIGFLQRAGRKRGPAIRSVSCDYPGRHRPANPRKPDPTGARAKPHLTTRGPLHLTSGIRPPACTGPGHTDAERISRIYNYGARTPNATTTLSPPSRVTTICYYHPPGNIRSRNRIVAPKKTEKPKVENDCTRAYDAIVNNTPALPTGGRLDRALQSSGLDVETQLSQAWKESSFNPSASAAPRSSALGMFQFLTGTARDVETRVWPNFVSRTTPFAPGVTGDWRLDPGVSAQANYVYLLDRVAASGGSLSGGLALYYGSRSAAANQDYANDVLGGRSVLQDFADKHGGNLREALEQDCAKIKAALSK